MKFGIFLLSISKILFKNINWILQKKTLF